MRADLLDLGDPAWPECLRALRHDFYHLPAYVALEAERMQAQPAAFLAEDGTRRLFVPFLQRACGAMFPEAGFGAELSDVTSPYGYPGPVLSDAARQAPDFTRAALDVLSTTLSSRRLFRLPSLHPLLSRDFSFLLPADVLTHHGETVAIDLTLDDNVLWKNNREAIDGRSTGARLDSQRE